MHTAVRLVANGEAALLTSSRIPGLCAQPCAARPIRERVCRGMRQGASMDRGEHGGGVIKAKFCKWVFRRQHLNTDSCLAIARKCFAATSPSAHVSNGDSPSVFIWFFWLLPSSWKGRDESPQMDDCFGGKRLFECGLCRRERLF
ncbi:unnamed protein product [Ostreobium quekettii]|uniref:Uncharacterized protein n=1 Tax=Ostreobium quekettii TaxID=121088 RepID=A0A8S1J429_9CHLO|nr:unnamed protein product [Ostreobium quekettii]